MKHLWVITLTVFLLLGISSAHAEEIYTFDSGHTYVLWRVSHFGFSNLTGKFLADGKLILYKDNIKNSQVYITIHMDDMSTGLTKLDEVLKGRSFFNVKRYPTATFVSNKIEVTGEYTGKIYGTLIVHGISKPVVLFVKLNRMGLHPFYRKKALGFSATTMIKRSDFDVDTYAPGVGNDVRLDIQAEALKQH